MGYKYPDPYDSIIYDRYSAFVGNGNTELKVYDELLQDSHGYYFGGDHDIRLDDTTTYFGIGKINAAYSTGNNLLWGDWKDNQITDGSGNGNLWGGLGGNDTLTGGEGADTFFFEYNGGHDVITDAESHDTIWLFNTNISDFRYYWYNYETNVMSLCLGTNGWEDGWLDVCCSNGTPWATYPAYQFADGTRLNFVGGKWVTSSYDAAEDTGANIAANPLWGNANEFFGTAQADNIFVSRTDGNDLVFDTDSADTVHFYDAALSDIVSTSVKDNAIAIEFNTGEIAQVSSSDNISPTFKLVSGQSYVYDRESSSWREA